ncbi:hypothetical protein SAMN05444414_10450 [Roseovarius marisflavi]|uniref:Lipoprotein n=1 Tax=Roseovarius marisflavi TaxID=1054996 RepID=A0A1M6XD62_9RHOB|nr:hypothetical protein [Roseovarius marisflavi]SHL03906.1 hypothetical protein SAMN05444414_10450 [Roseovarius marisflavi]
MKFYIVLGFPIALAACGAVTEPQAPTRLAAAATPEATHSHASSPSLLTGYAARAIKGPASWRELNERQSPDHKGAHE